MDISTGRYWDKPWSLVSGCTPCSPGCEHCWALAMERRFAKRDKFGLPVPSAHMIITHPERLDIPLKRRKPTVYAVWNDLFHEAVPDAFIFEALNNAHYAWLDSVKHARHGHNFLFLTKRPARMAGTVRDWRNRYGEYVPGIGGFYFGLTVCNQEEADEKIPVFLEVPGKKFLSIEPMLGPIDLDATCGPCHCWRDGSIKAVILGGETGPGARPLHPEWVRSVRDQCAAVGVPFYFKSWGKHIPDLKDCFGKEVVSPFSALAYDVRRLLDGRTHDELPWRG